MKTFLSLLLCLAFALHAQVTQLVPEQNNNKKHHVLTEPGAPGVFPLGVEDYETTTVTDLLDREHRPIHFTLVNLSDTPQVLTQVLSACPCLTVTKGKEEKTLAPGEKLKVEAIIEGNRLIHEVGKFGRFLMVEVKGYEFATMPIKGNRIPTLDIEPEKCLDLGTFSGNFPWKREFTVRNLLPEDKVDLLLPEKPSDLFNLAIEKTAPKTFKITVTPRLPLPSKRFVEEFRVRVAGLPNYPIIVMGVIGTVAPPALSIETSRLAVIKPDTPDKPYTAIAKLIYKPEAANKKRRHGRKNAAEKKYALKADEEQFKLMEKQETWTELAKTIVPRTIDGVTSKVEAQESSITVTFSIPKEVFDKLENDYFMGTIKQGSRLAGNFIVSKP